MCEKKCSECSLELVVFPDNSFTCIDPGVKAEKRIAAMSCAYAGAVRKKEDKCRQPDRFTSKEPPTTEANT